MNEHRQRRLIPAESGGFQLEHPRSTTIQVNRTAESWVVSGDGDVEGWCIRDEERGFRLERNEGELAGRCLRTFMADRREPVVSVLLADGRLFRIGLRGPRDARFELTGWETPGAYFEARPTDDGWTVTATAAGMGMQDAEPLVLILAAYVRRSEEEA